MMAKFTAMLLSAATLAATGGTAAAKSTTVVAYRYGAVWSTAVRLVRVDSHFKITDKDKENGYILFVYPGRGSVKECSASLELVPVGAEKEASGVKVQLNIANQPAYVEVHLLDRLEQKLAAEQGPPRPPKPPAKPTDPPPEK